jgi:hypothetical protein
LYAAFVQPVLKVTVLGSHHIFSRPDVEEILNLQPRGGQAKPYQVKQVRQIVLKYKLGGEDEA